MVDREAGARERRSDVRDADLTLDHPQKSRLAWLGYFAFALAWAFTAFVVLVGLAGLGFSIIDARGAAMAIALFAIFGGGLAASAVLALKRRIYWAWAGLVLAWATSLLTALASALNSFS
jgi:pheromone shutdown protein TraB